MGKHSGRHAFKEKLKELGYSLGDNALEEAFKRFKDLADRKKIVYDEDLEALVDDEIGHAHERIKVEALTVIAGTDGSAIRDVDADIDGSQSTTKRLAMARSMRSSMRSMRWCRITPCSNSIRSMR